MKKSNQLIKRFYSNVIKTPTCWEYNGHKNKDGYNTMILVENKQRKYVTVHRVSAFLHGMDIEGRCVCHTCDNPGCVNPDHLFTGSNSDNMADKVAKGRQSKGISHSIATKRGIANAKT